MVSKKRQDRGFNGYRAPIIPKAPRSTRRRRPRKNSVEDSKLCAFELLAAVAGKLLHDSESSVSSNVEVQLEICQDGDAKGQLMSEKALKSEGFDNGSCAESSFVPETSIWEHHLSSSVKEPVSSDVSKKVDCDSKLEICEMNNADGNITCEVGGPSSVGDSLNPMVGAWPEIRSEDDRHQIGKLYMGNASTVKDPIEEHVNTNMLIKSDGSVQLPLYRDPIPNALMQKHWNNVKLRIRDDDDNSFGCKRYSTKMRPFRPQPRVGHRKIRKMLTSKYRKMAPKWKSRELYQTSEQFKSFYQYRKRIYTRDRCQQAPIKKRKLFDHKYEVAYDQEASSNSIISNAPGKRKMIDKSSSAVVLERATGALDVVKGHKNVKDPHVKFSIKSFKVPELYIEVPETASVGSLKRTVMEAVTAILGSGIRVGVVLQGKRVRDDNRTLQQAGISQGSNLDSLGFTLEPCLPHISPSTTPQNLPSLLPCHPNQELPRSPATPVTNSGISNASVNPPYVATVDDFVGPKEFISITQTPSNEMMDGAVLDSKALVTVPPTNLEPLAVVPVNPKPKRSELSQRRSRRPFSVAEVEALVEAVEKLGTGRWRDVKMGSFENADHRTYVDLKDKWKTLVHTASISPHQRRGEPVPQELLDRVLSAHSHWSQHQSRQHGKQPVEPLTVDPVKEVVGASDF